MGRNESYKNKKGSKEKNHVWSGMDGERTGRVSCAKSYDAQNRLNYCGPKKVATGDTPWVAKDKILYLH